jgi:hypothetical protein
LGTGGIADEVDLRRVARDDEAVEIDVSVFDPGHAGIVAASSPPGLAREATTSADRGASRARPDG